MSTCQIHKESSSCRGQRFQQPLPPRASPHESPHHPPSSRYLYIVACWPIISIPHPFRSPCSARPIPPPRKRAPAGDRSQTLTTAPRASLPAWPRLPFVVIFWHCKQHLGYTNSRQHTQKPISCPRHLQHPKHPPTQDNFRFPSLPPSLQPPLLPSPPSTHPSIHPHVPQKQQKQPS
ncbi:uncharacterized protein J3D65DRAFT_624035 [Phyllosticta citribraziliensis]|uniref:Uncharacterized protein n=1 Tax=Phyllosticta citribraziliensis TaxID=989973 RepID=A0ABR1LP93_9PEZI